MEGRVDGSLYNRVWCNANATRREEIGVRGISHHGSPYLPQRQSYFTQRVSPLCATQHSSFKYGTALRPRGHLEASQKSPDHCRMSLGRRPPTPRMYVHVWCSRFEIRTFEVKRRKWFMPSCTSPTTQPDTSASTRESFLQELA